MKVRGSTRSTGEQRKVTGIHDEAGVQAQVIYEDKKQKQLNERRVWSYFVLLLQSTNPMKRPKQTNFVFIKDLDLTKKRKK